MTRTFENINLETWFVDREVEIIPEHFIHVVTPITKESKIWILEKLRGRFSLVSHAFSDLSPAFEDPKEAVFYELTWG